MPNQSFRSISEKLLSTKAGRRIELFCSDVIPILRAETNGSTHNIVRRGYQSLAFGSLSYVSHRMNMPLSEFITTLAGWVTSSFFSYNVLERGQRKFENFFGKPFLRKDSQFNALKITFGATQFGPIIIFGSITLVGNVIMPRPEYGTTPPVPLETPHRTSDRDLPVVPVPTKFSTVSDAVTDSAQTTIQSFNNLGTFISPPPALHL